MTARAERNSVRTIEISYASVDRGIEWRSKGKAVVDSWMSVIVEHAPVIVVVALEKVGDLGISIGKQQAIAFPGAALKTRILDGATFAGERGHAPITTFARCAFISDLHFMVKDCHDGSIQRRASPPAQRVLFYGEYQAK